MRRCRWDPPLNLLMAELEAHIVWSATHTERAVCPDEFAVWWLGRHRSQSAEPPMPSGEGTTFPSTSPNVLSAFLSGASIPIGDGRKAACCPRSICFRVCLPTHVPALTPCALRQPHLVPQAPPRGCRGTSSKRAEIQGNCAPLPSCTGRVARA